MPEATLDSSVGVGSCVGPAGGSAGPLQPVRQPVARLKHIRELDGLRGIAALMVFFHHTLAGGTWPGLVGVASAVAVYGRYGVDLFFVLSGFLITSLLYQDRESSRYYQDFYWKRALRILPVYLVLLAVTLAVTHAGKTFLLSLFFLANFASVFGLTQTGPFWTLAIEEQFYLLWPTVVRRRALGQLEHWAMGVGLAAVLLRLVAAWFGHFDYQLTFLRCDGLAFGALLACYFQKDRRGDLRRGSRRLGGLLLAGVAVMALERWIEPSTRGWREFALATAVLQTGVTMVAGSVVGLAILKSGNRWMGVLRGRVLTFFGLISYAFYMVHAPMMAVCEKLLGRVPEGNGHKLLLHCGVTLLMTVALSLLSRYVLELPAISLRKWVLVHPSKTADAEEPPLPLAQM